MRWAKIQQVENGYLVTYAESWDSKEKQRVCTDIQQVTETIQEIFSGPKS